MSTQERLPTERRQSREPVSFASTDASPGLHGIERRLGGARVLLIWGWSLIILIPIGALMLFARVKRLARRR
jgi:hypothetical protein